MLVHTTIREHFFIDKNQRFLSKCREKVLEEKKASLIRVIVKDITVVVKLSSLEEFLVSVSSKIKRQIKRIYLLPPAA